MTLHEAARKYGVETHYVSKIAPGTDRYYHELPRPDLDIAHDILAKLPMSARRLEIDYGEAGNVWRAWDWCEPMEHAGIYMGNSFIEAVLALAGRA